MKKSIALFSCALLSACFFLQTAACNRPLTNGTTEIPHENEKVVTTLDPILEGIEIGTVAQSLQVGTAVDLSALGVYSDGQKLPLADVDWTSADTNIVTVDANGHLVAIGSGITTVTASFEDLESDPMTFMIASRPQESPHAGPSVICTELHRQKLLPDDIYKADSLFGQTKVDVDTMANYHSWGIPVAKLMKNSPLFTKMVQPFATAWAYQMAYKMGVRSEPNALGEFLLNYGVPTSNTVGRAIRYLRIRHNN